MTDRTPRPVLYVKEPWGVPRASCAFSETSFYQLLGLACFLSPWLYSHLCSLPPPHINPSYYPVLSLFIPSLAPFPHFPHRNCLCTSFLPCSGSPRSSLFSLAELAGNCWLFLVSSIHVLPTAPLHGPCLWPDLEQFLIARIPSLPLCLCTCQSFEKILVL